MTFDHLSDGDFEEFIYDLVASLGFTNLNWRRGSGRGGATADQGRDIVADKLDRDPDGHERHDAWFVQCKHYKAGVPPEKIADALAWAQAERPAVLLFAISNFLSNPAKAFLETYKANQRPSFRIRIWERKDLEALVLTRLPLRQKYRIDLGLPDHAAHAAHLYYVLRPTFNSLSFLFKQLDRLNPAVRDHVMGCTYMAVIHPDLKEPVNLDQTFADLVIGSVDYASFRKKCFALIRGPAGMSEWFVVRSIVTQALAEAGRNGDSTESESRDRRNGEALGYFEEELDREADPDRRATLSQAIEGCRERIGNAAESQQQAERFYHQFCESVIVQLLLDDSKPKPMPDIGAIPRA